LNKIKNKDLRNYEARRNHIIDNNNNTKHNRKTNDDFFESVKLDSKELQLKKSISSKKSI